MKFKKIQMVIFCYAVLCIAAVAQVYPEPPYSFKLNLNKNDILIYTNTFQSITVKKDGQTNEILRKDEENIGFETHILVKDKLDNKFAISVQEIVKSYSFNGDNSMEEIIANFNSTNTYIIDELFNIKQFDKNNPFFSFFFKYQFIFDGEKMYEEDEVKGINYELLGLTESTNYITPLSQPVITESYFRFSNLEYIDEHLCGMFFIKVVESYNGYAYTLDEESVVNTKTTLRGKVWVSLKYGISILRDILITQKLDIQMDDDSRGSWDTNINFYSEGRIDN